MTSKALRLSSLVICSILGMWACGGGGIDSAAKSDIDHRVAAMMPTGQIFAAPTSNVPKPFVVGQWTQHRLVNERHEPSLITYKIVGEAGSAYWVEIASESYYGKTVAKLLITIPDRGNPNTMDILAIKTKDKNGKVAEFQGPTVQLLRASYQSALNMIAVSWRGLPQETVRVVAGNFSDCYKARTDATWGVWRANSISWMHPVVPISGLVKSVGIDRATSMELVGFGETGATSEIP
jgi:hypothetical protein